LAGAARGIRTHDPIITKFAAASVLIFFAFPVLAKSLCHKTFACLSFFRDLPSFSFPVFPWCFLGSERLTEETHDAQMHAHQTDHKNASSMA
jgi:hypothetical protein